MTRLASVARSLASAMNSAGVRLDVLAAMRSSPRVDHSLILDDYLVLPRPGELLDVKVPMWSFVSSAATLGP